jgi:hypothetical protein
MRGRVARGCKLCRASTISSTGFSRGDSSCPGRVSSAPKASSANDIAQSYLGTTWRPKRTHWGCSDHLLPASLAHRVSLIWQWVRSTIPFLWGWYAVVVMWLILSLWHSPSLSAEVNCRPLSVVSASGMPLCATHLLMKASTHWLPWDEEGQPRAILWICHPL